MDEDGQSVADLLQHLRASVAERRAAGQYPPGLEADLDAHFQRIVASRRQVPGLAALRRQIEAARRASHFSGARIPTTTRLPGGSTVHQGMARLFLRQTQGILTQVQEFAERTLEALDGVAALVERPDNHDHADLVERIDALGEAVADLTRAGRAEGASGEPGADIARRLERLERAHAARRWRPWFGRERFYAVFDQGQRAAMAVVTAAALGERTPVMELSPGGDGSPLASLAGCADASLGGVVAVGVEDLLSAPEVLDLVALAYERLAPDGRLLVASGAPARATAPDGPPPPAVPSVRFDPTLGPALPAAYVAFACREAGFATVDVEEWSKDGYLVTATR